MSRMALAYHVDDRLDGFGKGMPPPPPPSCSTSRTSMSRAAPRQGIGTIDPLYLEMLIVAIMLDQKIVNVLQCSVVNIAIGRFR